MPLEKLFGSKLGIDAIASTSPVRQSITPTEPDSGPSRRADYSCRSASTVSCTVLPCTSACVDSSRTPLPRTVTSTLPPPCTPHTWGSQYSSTSALHSLHPGYLLP